MDLLFCPDTFAIHTPLQHQLEGATIFYIAFKEYSGVLDIPYLIIGQCQSIAKVPLYFYYQDMFMQQKLIGFLCCLSIYQPKAGHFLCSPNKLNKENITDPSTAFKVY